MSLMMSLMMFRALLGLQRSRSRAPASRKRRHPWPLGPAKPPLRQTHPWLKATVSISSQIDKVGSPTTPGSTIKIVYTYITTGIVLCDLACCDPMLAKG